ncbi:hypothetical protein RJ639_011999 [Escallonia herrerae]|uniref:PGG domain-containing protein n=1 Tax=Escallonia herrerae TaxID=1293975 RepID=A0AA88VNA5_9ASTE|nr:hypothetical protein RJ639_011999 [Escallonia herrerae]
MQDVIKEKLKKAGPLGQRKLISRHNIVTAERARIKEHGKDLDFLKKVAQTHLIVATLIATVTFAAGFTLPGCYESNDVPNKGLSVSSTELMDAHKVRRHYAFAGLLILIAVVAMKVVTFPAKQFFL